MLFSLAEYLSQHISFFGVFQYLTLRAILGVITALTISLLVGPVMIRRLSFHQIVLILHLIKDKCLRIFLQQ